MRVGVIRTLVTVMSALGSTALDLPLGFVAANHVVEDLQIHCFVTRHTNWKIYTQVPHNVSNKLSRLSRALRQTATSLSINSTDHFLEYFLIAICLQLKFKARLTKTSVQPLQTKTLPTLLH